MRKKMRLSEGKMEKQTNFTSDNGIVGVIGSIPFASTKLRIPKNVKTIELSGQWDVLPAAKMTKTGPTLTRVLVRRTPKKFENNLNRRKRRSKSA